MKLYVGLDVVLRKPAFAWSMAKVSWFARSRSVRSQRRSAALLRTPRIASLAWESGRHRLGSGCVANCSGGGSDHRC
jgi:hypothetical protein